MFSSFWKYTFILYQLDKKKATHLREMKRKFIHLSKNAVQIIIKGSCTGSTANFSENSKREQRRLATAVQSSIKIKMPTEKISSAFIIFNFSFCVYFVFALFALGCSFFLSFGSIRHTAIASTATAISTAGII